MLPNATHPLATTTLHTRTSYHAHVVRRPGGHGMPQNRPADTLRPRPLMLLATDTGTSCAQKDLRVWLVAPKGGVVSHTTCNSAVTIVRDYPPLSPLGTTNQARTPAHRRPCRHGSPPPVVIHPFRSSSTHQTAKARRAYRSTAKARGAYRSTAKASRSIPLDSEGSWSIPLDSEG
jgi:hypothetical protein